MNLEQKTNIFGNKWEKFWKGSTIASGLLIGLIYAYSIWSPGNKGAEVFTRPDVRFGKPEKVLTKYDTRVTQYTEASLYPADLSDYAKEDSRHMIMPSRVTRFEHDETRGTIFRIRKGTRMSNPSITAGEQYAIQFDCPSNFSGINVHYAGRLIETELWNDENTGMVIAKGTFTGKPGKNRLKAEVTYHTGGKDQFNVLMNGAEANEVAK
jgi:hypothetical protein